MHTFYGIYQKIRGSAWACLWDFHITSLPVDVRSIARRADVRIIANQSFPILRRHERAVTYYTPEHRIIVYDEALPTEEIRLTLAHELGHLFLAHDKAYEKYADTRDERRAISERQADRFAERLLCPACVLAALDLHTAEEIAEICHVPLSLAKKRARRMETLYRRNQFCTDPLEQRLFESFKPFIESVRKAKEQHS